MTRFTEREYAEVLERARRKSRPAISEKDFQQNVKDFARMLGWKTYHTLRSTGSDPGFPDLIMLREGRMIVAELKREGSDSTQIQREWLAEFRRLQEALGNPIGILVCVWRPSDWETIQKVLR